MRGVNIEGLVGGLVGHGELIERLAAVEHGEEQSAFVEAALERKDGLTLFAGPSGVVPPGADTLTTMLAEAERATPGAGAEVTAEGGRR